MDEILSFNQESILVLTHKGVIKRLYCPFLVRCIETNDGILENTVCYVDRIYDDPNDRILYMIGGNLFPYHFFLIQIVFK